MYLDVHYPQYTFPENYPGPMNNFSVALKRYTPFFMNMLNLINLTMISVSWSSFSYLADRAVKFSANPIATSYTVAVDRTVFTFRDVVF